MKHGLLIPNPNSGGHEKGVDWQSLTPTEETSQRGVD